MKLNTKSPIMLCLAATISMTTMACGPGDDNGDNGDNATTNTTNAQLLDCSSFGEDLTLEDNVDGGVDYIVDCLARVDGDLTVEPGVIIQFKQDSGLNMAAGSLSAKGTADKPIIFTGETQVRGSWYGVQFVSTSAKNALEHVTVEYAGQDQFDVFGVRGAVGLQREGRLSVKNSTFKESADVGFHAPDSASTLTFENNTSVDNDSHPVSIHQGLLAELDEASKLEGNGKNSVLVTAAGTSDVNGVEGAWGNLSVPYFVAETLSIQGESSITIAPGATFVFAADTGVVVASDSSLSAEGSEGAIITFTGEVEEKGAWLGIAFDSNTPQNKLEHVLVDYAGSDQFDVFGERGGVVIKGDAKLSIKNSTISNSKEFGLDVEYGIEGLTFENNTITGCDKEPINVPFENLTDIDSESNLTGNARDFVRVEESRQRIAGTSAYVLQNLSVPYFFPNDTRFEIGSEGGLTIEAGTKLYFGANASLGIKSESFLNVVGTADAKVEFLGANETAQSWVGMSFDSNNTNNRLEHVIVKHGGSAEFDVFGQQAAVGVKNDSQLTIKDVEISESGPCGIDLLDDDSILIEEGMNSIMGSLLGICIPAP